MSFITNIINRLRGAASFIGRSNPADAGLPLAQFGQGDQARYIDSNGTPRHGDGLREFHRAKGGRGTHATR